MPESVISSLFTRVSSRASLSNHRCTVQLLDDSESIQVDFKKSDTGQTVVDYVCDYLQIVEKDYFGLRFIDTVKHRYWLDATKPILKQIKGNQPIIFRFRVRYYPADPTIVKEEITRYQLFLQLRRDLLHGRLYAPQNDAAILGAYIIQSEQGDYDPEVNKEGYVSEFKLFLKQTAKVEERVEEVHKTLRGELPAEAEENFVQSASKLDTYGFDPYTVKDLKVGQVYLGATHLGIIVYQSNKKLHHITWDELDKVDYLGKDFYVYPKPEHIADNNLTLPLDNGEVRSESRMSAPNMSSSFNKDSKKRSLVLRFQCPSAQFCKHLWKHTLGQRAFFTEPDASHVKAQHSKRRIPVLSRGSTFRYAGRVLQEIKEDEPIPRPEPSFVRYHADRQPSRQERSFPWNGKYATLPRASSKDKSEKLESNGVNQVLDIQRDTSLLLETVDGVSPSYSPAELSPESEIIASSDLNTSLYRGETGSPLSNSTPLKIQPVKISDTNELKNRFVPPGETLDKTTISVSLSSQEEVVPQVNKGPVSTEETSVESSSRPGMCCRLMGHLLTGMLLTIILVTVVVVMFEVKDHSFRQYVHAIPGLESFRHIYYEPGRDFAIRQYANVLGARSRMWFFHNHNTFFPVWISPFLHSPCSAMHTPSLSHHLPLEINTS